MRLYLLLLSVFLLCSCQTASVPPHGPNSAVEIPKTASITRFSLAKTGVNGRLLSPGGWLGQDLEFKPYNDLRLQLEKDLGKILQNRGEAHVTIITPPEMKILNRTASAADILKLATAVDLGNAELEIVCLGQAQKDGLETYFVVVRSPRLLNFRKNVAKIAKNLKDFKAEEFYPHVTLGFTERDLHLQDGVVKNEKSCRNPIGL